MNDFSIDPSHKPKIRGIFIPSDEDSPKYELISTTKILGPPCVLKAGESMTVQITNEPGEHFVTLIDGKFKLVGKDQ